MKKDIFVYHYDVLCGQSFIFGKLENISKFELNIPMHKDKKLEENRINYLKHKKRFNYSYK